MDTNKIFFGDNLEFLKKLPTGVINLIYTDPPFNTGKKQKLVSLKDARKDTQTIVSSMSYNDTFDDFIDGFLKPRMIECHRLLKDDGCMFLHMDWHEIHYAKVMMDTIFGRDCFMNEIIWSYDFGARQKNKWPTKHDNILWYVKNPDKYTFHYEDMERIPYMAPGLVGKEKAEKGKTLTDVWWNTIVPTNGPERTGYPTQKPRKIVDRIVKIHSNPNDIVLDCFGGSGTLGESAIELGRKFILMDNNPESISVMENRFGNKTNYDIVSIENDKMNIRNIQKTPDVEKVLTPAIV